MQVQTILESVVLFILIILVVISAFITLPNSHL